jgi:hypothetical protein
MLRTDRFCTVLLKARLELAEAQYSLTEAIKNAKKHPPGLYMFVQPLFLVYKYTWMNEPGFFTGHIRTLSTPVRF